MSYPKALNFVLKWEGNYSNDPADPGGETKWGISKRAYPNLNIKDLTRDDAAKIYMRDYWNKVGCDTCGDPKLAFAMFDAAVNVGVHRVQDWLKNDFKPPKRLTVDEFNARRQYYYTSEVKESLRRRYLGGWLNRLNDLRKTLATLDPKDLVA